ncbi:DUF1659 domain-containing protein [Pseudoneobacillus sp. C159]
MAQSAVVDSNLRLVYEVGVNEKGEPVYKGKMYSNLKSDAAVDNVYQAVQAIASLCSFPLYNVERTDKLDIIA